MGAGNRVEQHTGVLEGKFPDPPPYILQANMSHKIYFCQQILVFRQLLQVVSAGFVGTVPEPEAFPDGREMKRVPPRRHGGQAMWDPKQN